MRDVDEEAFFHQPRRHPPRDARQPHADEADRRIRRRWNGQLDRGEQSVAVIEAIAQPSLQLVDLVREVDSGRCDRRPQQRGLDGAREHHRGPTGPHLPPRLGVGEHERRAAGAERLVQAGGEHHARVNGDAVERDTAAVPSLPAHAVGVVHVEVELLVPLAERRDVLERREVPVHAVDAVRHVPDVSVALAQLADALLEPVQPAVAHQLDVCADRLQQPGRQLDAVVDLLIEDHGVALVDQRRNRRQMRQRRGGSHERVGLEDGAQQLFELFVEWRRHVYARRRELGPVALGGVDGALLETGIQLEAEVAAGTEVNEVPSIDANGPAVQPGVFGREVPQAETDALGDHPVDDLNPVGSLPHVWQVPSGEIRPKRDTGIRAVGNPSPQGSLRHAETAH
jgi:hypothetical protein